MGEQHLDALSLTARLLECFGLCHRPGNIAGRLVEAARDSAHRRLRTALRFDGAATAIAYPGPVVECLPITGQLAGRRQNLAGRADVNVAFFVEGEVFAAEGPVLSLRLVIGRDVRRYLGPVDQPVEVGTRTVAGIASKPFGLETEALLRSLNHGLCRTDLGLANGPRGLDINDDAELHVDEIVVGVSEECRSLVRSGPLGRRIGWRDELRHHVARPSPGRITE